jgi:hypothetical protein
MEERFAGPPREALDRPPDRSAAAWPIGGGPKKFARLEPGEIVACAAMAGMR